MKKKILPLLLSLSLIVVGGFIYINNQNNSLTVKLPILSKNVNSPTNFDNINPVIKVSFKNSLKLNSSLSSMKLYLMADYQKKILIPINYKTVGNDLLINLPILLPSKYDFIIGNIHHPFSIIESSTNNVKANIPNCNKLVEYQKVLCLKRYYYLKTIKDDNVSKTINDLISNLDENPNLKNNCHAYIHVIGQTTAFLRNDFIDSFSKGSNICEYGYYHGIMEGFALKYDESELTNVMNTFCKEFHFGFNQGSCYHSLGHMVWIRSGGNFEKAVQLCQILPKDSNTVLSPQENCISGIAMNWAHAYQDAPKEFKNKLTPDSKEPANICLTIEDLKQQSGCWAFAGGIYNQDLTQMKHYLQLCQTLPEITSNTCWLNVGFLLGFETTTNINKAAKLCSTAKFDSAMWSCFGNLISNRTLLNPKGNYANFICKLSREIKRYSETQCQIMKEQELLRKEKPEATHILH